ncbi:MerR family transcriptional regulator [Alkalihalobacillus sp. 1P02AB]|uniref:MerR family transcriptional regulator n=1 Tax=Alkalihalobacillus sp. 1P02AB TaxID=3132260 RepID=UPI0039A76016
MYIKEFANKFHLSNDAVRYYEKQGLLSPIRSENGYRFYDEKSEMQMKLILVLKQLGFSLQEIDFILTLEQKPPSIECMEESSKVFQKKILEIENQMEFLQLSLFSLHKAQRMIDTGMYRDNKKLMEKKFDELYQQMVKGVRGNVATKFDKD